MQFTAIALRNKFLYTPLHHLTIFANNTRRQKNFFHASQGFTTALGLFWGADFQNVISFILRRLVFSLYVLQFYHINM